MSSLVLDTQLSHLPHFPGLVLEALVEEGEQGSWLKVNVEKWFLVSQLRRLGVQTRVRHGLVVRSLSGLQVRRVEVGLL